MSADDTTFFSMIKNIDVSGFDLNNNLEKISKGAFKWKINFNPGPTTQAQQLMFSHKVQMINHSQNIIVQPSLQKHLAMFLDSKLNFSENLHI